MNNWGRDRERERERIQFNQSLTNSVANFVLHMRTLKRKQAKDLEEGLAWKNVSFAMGGRAARRKKSKEDGTVRERAVARKGAG